MGKHFGNLQRLKGVTYYVLSPMELNPFFGIFNPGFLNMIRRLSKVIGIGIVPVTSGFLLYDWGMTTYKQNQRKNPNDYKDDV